MSGRIYADNAASTRLSEAALEAMLPWLRGGWGNPSAPHSMGQEAARALTRSRETVAACLGCDQREVVFTSGGTEADNLAILSAARLGARAGRRHIVSTRIEHHAVLRVLERLEREGFETEYLEVDENGFVSPEAAAAALREDTALVSVMFANNETGAVQPVAEIAALCRERGVTFHTDAVQAAGRIPVDFAAGGFDLLSVSAHKFHGPRGVGALLVRRGLPFEPLLLGGGQERGRRPGTENVAGAAGLAAALEESVRELPSRAGYLRALQGRAEAALSAIPRAKRNAPSGPRLPGFVSFCFPGAPSEVLLPLLDARGICASAGSACAAGSLEPSHVLLAMGRSRAEARCALRLSLSHENTPEDVEAVASAVREAVAALRGGACSETGGTA